MVDKRDAPEESNIEHINNVIASEENNSDNKEESVAKEKSSETKAKKEKKKEEVKVVAKKPVKKVIKKKIVKIEPKKEKVQKKSKEKSNLWIWISLAILGIIILGIIIFSSIKSKPVQEKNESIIAATVNGVPIYQKSIDEQYSKLNPMLQQIYTKEALLNQSINEELIMQYASENSIFVSEDEIDSEIELFKTENMLTDENFNKLLEAQQITLKELRDMIKKQVTIMKVINSTILDKITISDKEVSDYYSENKDFFVEPAQVTVRHILVPINQTFNESDAESLMKTIQKELETTDFCELVDKYSSDKGSIDSCGEYTFSEGTMVPEFEEAAFDMKISELRTVKTVYGIHLIQKIEDIEERTKKLDEVTKDIRTELRDSLAQEKFDQMINELRANAEIVVYSNTPKEVINPKEALAKCMTNKGAKFYGAYWCGHCANQKELFGDAMKFVDYVECADESNPQVQVDACNEAGISGYPTWVINGQKYPGEQSLEKLASLTGCQYN